MKVAVIYWSGTGNTKAMAEFVAEGAKSKGADVALLPVDKFSIKDADNYDAFAFGSPSMGDEVLEEYEFQPMWEDVQVKLNGKKVVLFGSYDWGDGEWMRIWEDEATCDILDTFICRLEPDAEAQADCKALGEKLV